MIPLSVFELLVRSTYESNIDETATGKLAANIVGGFNQYFSDALSEKMRDRTRQAVSAGRFPWRAPIGYINVGGKEGANIKPDEARAPFICRAFELMATGQFKKSQVMEIITNEGLRTQKGRLLSQQTFQAILRNPLYAGWVVLNDEGFTPVQGLHKPIVDQETYDRVQAILDGRKPSMVAKRKVNPAVPRRGLIRCDACGTPITGGECKGRGGKPYAHYWCPNPQCRAVKRRKSEMEGEFMTLLGRLRATRETIVEFPTVAAKVWESRQGGTPREEKRLTDHLEAQRKLKSELVKMRAHGELSLEEFEQAKAEVTVEIYQLEERLGELASQQVTTESFVRFAELQLMDIGAI